MGNIRIYIVDDEWMAIEYLKALLKEASPTYEVVGEAFWGAVAYEEILKMKPDIVFVDIQMPVMNGLELAEKVLKNNRQQKLIFLTSYRDFDFVKKGLELGVSAYMLKNELNAKELREEIEKLAADIQVERKKAHMYTEYNVANFLLYSENMEDGKTLRNSTLQRFALGLFVMEEELRINEDRRVRPGYDCMELENLKFPPGLLCRNVVQMENGKWCAIFYIGAKVAESGPVLEAAADIICQKLKEDGIPVTCLLDGPTRQFLDLPDMYKKMDGAAEYLYFKDKKILWLSEIGKKADAAADIHLAAFCYCMDEGDRMAAVYTMEKLLEVCKEQCSRGEFLHMIRDAFGILKRFLKRNDLEVPELLKREAFDSFKEVKSCLLGSIQEIFLEMDQKKEEQYSPAVGLALEFIHKSYQSNISVQDIASAAGISEGHLRKCFKSEIDETVVDYLTNYRIKKAKDMMKKKEHKISEIYEKVGFTSSQYFSYVFKKIEGKTPSEYMKTL